MSDSNFEYFDPDISLLRFNKRVLHYSEDPTIPAMERLKYLCISSANMDEFFGVKYNSGYSRRLESDAQEKVINKSIEINKLQYRVLNEHLIPEWESKGIFFKKDNFKEEELAWISEYFLREIEPVLTPIGIDPAHPFPKIANLEMHFFFKLRGKDAFGREIKHAIMELPRVFPRVVRLPSKDGVVLTTMSTVISVSSHLLFPEIKVMGCYPFRVTRDTNININENTSMDLLPNIKDQLLSRNHGKSTRLEVESDTAPAAIKYLQDKFNLGDDLTHVCEGPINLHRLTEMDKYLGTNRSMYYPSHKPKWPKQLKEYKRELPNPSRNIFHYIKDHGNIPLYHPYHTFEPVVELVRRASQDPQTQSIRITLYRTAKYSKIIQYLEQAARAGKEVTAVVELKARFDETNNIETAERLQRAGVNITYGILSHKTHAKMLLILRKENNKFRYYHHTSTGNYHEQTVKYYTDIGMLSCSKSIGRDIHKIFHQLTALAPTNKLTNIIQAPFKMKKQFLENIKNEIEITKNGGNGRIIAKMNGLQESDIVDALYMASQAGVKITLIVRGICTLIPGVEGVSENIEVKSVIGRFLEHSRIYYFENAGDSLLYLSTADLMSRNLNRRIEIAVPVRDEDIKNDILTNSLLPYLKDNVNSWSLGSKGNYTKIETDKENFCTQEFLLDRYS